MTQKPPAFQFYPDDFLGGVSDMTQQEVGAYILLLCHQWSRGEIPSDPSRAALIAKGEVSEHVMAKFPGGRNPRMEQVRQRLAEYSAKQSANGKIGLAKRWHSERYSERYSDAIATPIARNSSPVSSLQSPIIHTHTSGEVPTLTEIKAYASLHGITPESAQAFYDHHEGNQLWVNQHGKLINWQHKLAAWAAKDRAMPSKMPQDASKPVGGTTEAIIRQRELDDVTRQIASIRARDEHMSYSADEKAKLKQLKARQQQLKAALGWKV